MTHGGVPDGVSVSALDGDTATVMATHTMDGGTLTTDGGDTILIMVMADTTHMEADTTTTIILHTTDQEATPHTQAGEEATLTQQEEVIHLSQEDLQLLQQAAEVIMPQADHITQAGTLALQTAPGDLTTIAQM